MGRQALLPPRAPFDAGWAGPERAPVVAPSTSPDDPVPRRQVAVAVVGLVAVGLGLVAGHSSLFGDGSFYLLRAVGRGEVYTPPGREILNAVREAPVLVGVAAGVTNTRVLSFFQGIGFVLFPVLAWALALRYARPSPSRFSLVAITCGISFGSMIFFSVSELTLAFPLVVLVAVLLAHDGAWTRSQSWVVIGSSLILTRSHEAVAVCAVLVGLHAVLRATRGRDRRISWTVAGLSAGTVLGAVWTSSTSPNANSDSFFVHLRAFSPASTFAVLVGGMLLATAILLRSRTAGVARPPVLVLAAAVAMTGAGLVGAIRLGPQGAYASRGLCLLLVLSLQVTLLVHWRRSRERPPVAASSPPPSSWAVTFLLVLIAVPAALVPSWSRFLDDLRSTLGEQDAVAGLDEAVAPADRRFVWSWTTPTMSVVIRPPGARGVVDNDTDGWVPFPAADAPRQLPDRFSWR